MKPTNSFQEVIKSYLDERAKTDELFAVSYAKQNKSINECCDYILGEVGKRMVRNSSSIGVSIVDNNEDVYGMAVHYYDEDNVKINKIPGLMQVVSSKSEDSKSKEKSAKAKPEPKVKLSEKDKKKAREEAIRKLAEDQYKMLHKKPAKKAKAPENDVKQMSLFDYATED